MDFDNYKKGNLSEEELDKITGKLVKAKFRAAQKERWAIQLAAEHSIQRNIKKNIKRFSLSRRILAIAASVLILVALVPFLQQYLQPEYQQLANQYIDIEAKLPATGIERGGTTTIELNSAFDVMAAYNNDKFKEVIQYYMDRQKSGNQLLPREYLFLGLSYLYESQWVLAITNLEQAQLLLSEEDALYNATSWFTALAYLKNDNLNKAKRQLDVIANSDSSYSDEAKEIMESLKK